jgi:hypothetical protein
MSRFMDMLLKETKLSEEKAAACNKILQDILPEEYAKRIQFTVAEGMYRGSHMSLYLKIDTEEILVGFQEVDEAVTMIQEVIDLPLEDILKMSGRHRALEAISRMRLDEGI